MARIKSQSSKGGLVIMRAKARVAWVAAMVMALTAFVPGTSQAAIKPLSFDGITISNVSNPGEDIIEVTLI